MLTPIAYKLYKETNLLRQCHTGGHKLQLTAPSSMIKTLLLDFYDDDGGRIYTIKP